MASSSEAVEEAAIGCEMLSHEEENVNTAIHGLGFLLSLAGIAAMLCAATGADMKDAAACLVYATTLTAMYAVSALSHAVRDPARKQLLRAWDQGVIYFLIVGNYTPLMWKFVPTGVTWSVLPLLWLAAAAGFYSKVVLQHRVDGRFSAATYLLLGWLPALCLVNYLPWACLGWVLAGGLCYTAGVPFLKFDRKVRYFHAVWHVFVVLGSACHFYAVYVHVLTG